MKSFICFLLGAATASLLWVLNLQQYQGYTLVCSKVGDGYEVNMMSSMPIVGVTNNAVPDVKVVMLGNAKTKVVALLTPKTRLVCTRIIPQEEGFSPNQFSDEHGQKWKRMEGRDFSPNAYYQGTITTDGKDVYFKESQFTGKKLLGVWKLL